jgi:MoaA/NifB/PqqE/SkfB family radical SAM enzyme
VFTFAMNLAEPAVAPPLPGFVQIEPVGDREGLRGKAPGFISYETYCRLLDQFPGLRQLQLQGLGEPLLHPRFFDMVRHAVARGIEVSTTSRLVELSERRAEECVTSGLLRLQVALDPADPGFAMVLRHLERLAGAQRRFALERPELRFTTTVTRRNLDMLPDLVRSAHRFGVAALFVRHGAPRVEHSFERARTLALELGVSLRLPAAEPRLYGKKSATRCDAPWRGAYVNLSGLGLPCSLAASPGRTSLGDMAKEGVLRVWTGDAYRAFREQLASGEAPEPCKACPVYQGIL